MKPLQFLFTIPKSKIQRLGLLITLFILAISVSVGFYGLANRLVGGEGNFLSTFNLTTSEREPESTSLPGNTISFPEPATIPDGLLTAWDGTSRVTVLVMGLDFRDWSAGEGPSRTDTMMLLTLDPLNNTAGMLSIPRDLWVSIPGFENGRINTAYFLGESYQMPGGGPGLAVQTVEQLLGVQINYYAQVDFGAFTRFVDELGGVKVDVPKKINVDPIVGDPIILRPGRQTLNGELALAYARARNTKGGDLDRALRQQQVIFGIRERLLEPDDLSLLISKAPALYSEIASGVQTNMTLEELIKLALLAQKVPEENISRRAISANEVIFAESPDEQSVLVPLPEKIRQLRDEVFLVSTGTLGPLLPGTSQERMAAEGAKIVLLNGSLVDGLAGRTQVYLQSQGANVVEISNGEFLNHTRIVDYTGNPHTAQYLAELFGVLPEYYALEYDPDSPVDVVVTLGVDWSTQEIPPTSDQTTTYQDESIGFALDYPAGWTRIDVETGERGSIVAIASWEISPQNMDSTPPGETRLDISVLQWEPLDLDAYVTQRKIAWDASGISIINEERRNNQEGLPVVEFRVAGVDGEEAYFLVALISDRFVTLGGSGNYGTMTQIGKTMRIVP